MADPERYVAVDDLTDELPYSASAFDVDDFSAFLSRILDEESERMESGTYASRTWGLAESPDDDPVPGPVRDGVIRLVRSRLGSIQSDGLESESIPTGQSATFRHPEEVRREVRASVEQYRPKGDGDTDVGAWVV